MNSSSLNNARNRMIWLDKIINTEISPSIDFIISLKDMRSFCALEINGYFKKISYNTLQSAVMSNKLSIMTDVTASDRWTLIKRKRGMALTVAEQAFPSISKHGETTKERDYKAELKECLWHATFCSQAYLELHNGLKNFLESTENTLSDLDKIRLKRIFDKSRIMYLKVISPTPISEPTKFILIDGGKNV